MGDKSQIQWTDATWNPVTGCDKISPGCKFCYAERIFPRAYGKFRRFTDVVCHDDRLDQPLHWKKPRKIFVNSMSDLFHENVPDDFIARVWTVMSRTPQHVYQILTKRHERLNYRVCTLVQTFGILPNVWLGVSVESQMYADKRIPLLLETPAAVRFVSYEPALESVNFRYINTKDGPFDSLAHIDVPHDTPMDERPYPGIDWIIVGGESGGKARAFYPRWARSVVEQCTATKTACFVKQLGANIVDRNDAGFEGDEPHAWPMDTHYDELDSGYQGAPVRIRLHDSHGGNMEEWPEDLRVRQFPNNLTAPSLADPD